jgi:hypothetical protein
MVVSSEADEVLRQIRELRAARQERLQLDLNAIDAAYDRQLRRIRSGMAGGKSAAAFPLVKSIYDRSRYCCLRSMMRLQRRLSRRDADPR